VFLFEEMHRLVRLGRRWLLRPTWQKFALVAVTVCISGWVTVFWRSVAEFHDLEQQRLVSELNALAAAAPYRLHRFSRRLDLQQNLSAEDEAKLEESFYRQARMNFSA